MSYEIDGFFSFQRVQEPLLNATLATCNDDTHGIILLRKYSEMKLINLDSLERAIREEVKG